MKTRIALLLACTAVLAAANEAALRRRAMAIHHRALTLDTHCDTPMMLMQPGWDIGRWHETGRRGSGRQDLPRMVAGGLDSSFFAVFVSQGPRTPEGNARARQEAERILDALDRMFAGQAQRCGRALAPADAYRLERRGKRAIFIGMENGYPLGNDPALVDHFYRRGVRYITLAHTADNDLCDSSTDRQDPEDRGLSELGRAVVERMNGVGMMVDVSHVSDRSFSDVLRVSRAPVIASHSSARALCPSPRNLSDEQLRALQVNGGVIQICILSDYIRESPPNPERDQAFAEFRRRIRERFGSWAGIQDPVEREKVNAEYEALDEKYPQQLATVKDAVDHIDHVVRLIGVDHVGIGTDFDGGGGLADCRDVTGMKNITLELVRRGYSEKDIVKIWGGNLMRVFRRVIEIGQRSR